MSGLRAALKDGPIGLRRSKTAVVEPVALRKALSALPALDIEMPAEDALEQAQRRVSLALEAGLPEQIVRRDLRDCARGYLSGPLPVGRQRNLRDRFLTFLERRPRRSAILGLIGAYLDRFALSDEAIVALAAWLDAHYSEWAFRNAEIWARRAQVFKLFQPALGPQLIAEAVCGTVSKDIILQETGLDRGREFGGFGESVFRAACEAVLDESFPNTAAVQLRLTEWARREDRLGYDGVWPEYARALVEPWGEGASVPAAHRNHIINELIAYAGDPRTGRSGKWAMLDGTLAKAILLRWLTRASVLQFLGIVDRTADPHMWSYRRAFWTSYLQAEHIDAAWVAFCANGAELAHAAARRTGDDSLKQFGLVARGTGKTADHAALIMTIGDLTIVDWSHNGKYNIWLLGHKGAPKLYMPEYSGYRLSKGPINGSHVNSEGMLWQRRIADVIAKNTGRRVNSDQWIPKRRK